MRVEKVVKSRTEASKVSIQALKSGGGISECRIATHGKRLSWWLWPNVLSLDAPMVALVWHGAFAKAFGVPLDAVAAALLGLAVWVIYVVDRLLDVVRVGDSGGEVDTMRHGFHGRHWRGFLVGVMVALVVAAVLMAQVERRLLIFGALMISVSVVYGWLVHRRVVRVPKELVCGVVFGVGVLASLFVVPVPWVSMVLFGALCTVNCVVISFTEGEISLKWARWIGVGGLLLGIVSVWIGGLIQLAMAGSFLGLLGVHFVCLPREMKRVLADVVLLTPVLVWFWL